MIQFLKAIVYTLTMGDSSSRKDNLFELFKARGQKIVDEMKDYIPDDSQLEKIAESMPDLDSESSAIADFVIGIQQEFFIKPFIDEYHLMMHEYRYHMATLNSEEYQELILRIGIIQTQLVQIMAFKTSIIVAAAQAIAATPPEPIPEPVEKKDEIISPWIPSIIGEG